MSACSFPEQKDLGLHNVAARILLCIIMMHRLEKYLNLESFLEKSLKIKSALKSTEKPLKSLEKFLNSTIFCRT